MRCVATALALTLSTFALSGCHYLLGSSEERLSDAADSQAAANVTAAMPAIEAYRADHGTYVGISVRRLREEQPEWVVQDVRFFDVREDSYCVESEAENELWSSRGPWGDVEQGGCLQ
jgi:hypothetical protein